MKELVKYFENKTINSVLDIGTGTGEFISLISQAFSNKTKYIGVEPDSKVVEEAIRENTNENISFVEMKGENLSFENNSFDLVCISNALHHLGNPEKTLSEMKRVLKPEGYIIIAEIVSDKLNEAQETQKILHHFKSYVDRKKGITHRETWTESEVIEIATSNGIKPSGIFDYNRMEEAVMGRENQEKWVKMFAEILEKLKGQTDYDKKSELFEEFLNRLDKHGFQLARQLVIISQIV